MKSKLLVILLLAGGSLFARSHVSVSVGVGFGAYHPYGYGGYYVAPAPPLAPRVYAPAPVYPGAGYAWIGGYYYPVGARYEWRSGYWARPPYAGARWIAPRYTGGRYYTGYWRRR